LISDVDLDRVAGLSSRKAAKVLSVGKSTINDARARRATQAVDASVSPQNPGPRILALDLELTPLTAYTWSLWPKSIPIGMLIDSAEVICFGARWLGTTDVVFRSVHHDGKDAMLSKVYEMVDQADAVMGWNSKGFDSKHLNREFLEAGMYPPSPWKELDLMLEVKRAFRFPSNKLDYVAQRLGVGGKVNHTGFDMWIKCMAGDDAAWELMREYQIQDVNLLIELYAKLRPWLKGVPNWGLYTGEEGKCPTCGSEDTWNKGGKQQYTGVSAFEEYRCRACGTVFRGAKRVATTDSRR
jgi:hypothetical protein